MTGLLLPPKNCVRRSIVATSEFAKGEWPTPVSLRLVFVLSLATTQHHGVYKRPGAENPYHGGELTEGPSRKAK